MSVREIAPGEVARPLWGRTRFWLGLAGVVVLGGLLIALVSPAPGRDLDPDSAAKGGSKALAQLMRDYGIDVKRTTQLAVAARADRTTSVLVVAPDDYSRSQLATLLAGPARVVLLDPDRSALALDPALQIHDTVAGPTSPGCSAAGARAAGDVELPDQTTTYRATNRAAHSCYAGALVVGGRLAVLGSADLLRNDAVSRPGVAALDINVLSADRTLGRVVWLLPGSDAGGPGAPSVWDLFPPGAHRAFIWLIVAGAVAVLWRARRLGPPVPEPLPVVVRAAEAVEGHGRLYRRAHARDRAAAALRAGAAARLARHAGLPRAATTTEIGAAVDIDPTRVRQLLDGPAPRDDTELVELAAALRELEAAAGVSPEEEGRA